MTVYTRPAPPRSAPACATAARPAASSCATSPEAEAWTSPRVTPAPSPTAYSPEMASAAGIEGQPGGVELDLRAVEKRVPAAHPGQEGVEGVQHVDQVAQVAIGQGRS